MNDTPTPDAFAALNALIKLAAIPPHVDRDWRSYRSCSSKPTPPSNN